MVSQISHSSSSLPDTSGCSCQPSHERRARQHVGRSQRTCHRQVSNSCEGRRSQSTLVRKSQKESACSRRPHHIVGSFFQPDWRALGLGIGETAQSQKESACSRRPHHIIGSFFQPDWRALGLGIGETARRRAARLKQCP